MKYSNVLSLPTYIDLCGWNGGFGLHCVLKLFHPAGELLHEVLHLLSRANDVSKDDTHESFVLSSVDQRFFQKLYGETRGWTAGLVHAF